MSIALVRMLVGDRIKKAVNEVVGKTDGVNTRFQLDMFPLASSPTAVLTLISTGKEVTAANYVISGGVGVITFNAASTTGNTAGQELLAVYDYHALTSGEISDILSGLTARPYLAAANAALILAADASRLFAYTMGDKSVDKRKVAENLRELSAELETRDTIMVKRGNYKAGVFTHFDPSNTVYDGYDTAVSYLSDD